MKVERADVYVVTTDADYIIRVCSLEDVVSLSLLLGEMVLSDDRLVNDVLASLYQQGKIERVSAPR